MNISNLIIVTLFLLLTIPPSSRKAAILYLVFYSFYFNWIIPLTHKEELAHLYFAVNAAFDFVLMWLLLPKYFWVGVLSFALIPVNFFGWVLYENYYPPTTYDIIAKIIIFTQIILIIVRGLNGIGHIFSKLPYGDWILRAANINGREAYKILFKG